MTIGAVVALIWLAAETALRYGSLPERIPTQWGFGGQVNTYGSRATVWLLVGLGAVLWAGLSALERVPHIFNYPWRITEANAPAQYRLARLLIMAIKAWSLVLFAAINHLMMNAALGGEGPGTAFMLLSLGSLAGLLLAYFMMAARIKDTPTHAG